MREAARLKTEMPNDQRHLIAAQLRAMEESCLRLVELLRPFDASLVRRQPLPQEKAELLQRFVTRLRSGISQAAWDLGLPRGHQDARREAAVLVVSMRNTLGDLRQIAEQTDLPAGLGGYLEKLGGDLQHTMADIERLVGKTVSEAVVAG